MQRARIKRNLLLMFSLQIGNFATPREDVNQHYLQITFETDLQYDVNYIFLPLSVSEKMYLDKVVVNCCKAGDWQGSREVWGSTLSWREGLVELQVSLLVELQVSLHGTGDRTHLLRLAAQNLHSDLK